MNREQDILVFNCGSSSLGCKIFHCGEQLDRTPSFSAKAHRVGVKGSETSFVEYRQNENCERIVVALPDHRAAARHILEYLRDKELTVSLIGHRFVHGGEFFKKSVMIDKGVLKKLGECRPLAPLHNPLSLSVIHESQKALPGHPQFAVFDTAFHSAMPDYAYTYAVPMSVRERFHYRRYGFHGLSYAYIARAAPAFLGLAPHNVKMVACHLGTGGSSVCAIQNGVSLDCSMGYSPLMGLLMSTRCGDIDPMLTLYLLMTYDMRPDDVLSLLTEKSGLLGIAGFSSDLRDILNNASPEDEDRAHLAFQMYTHRLKKYIGSYIAVLSGIDALVFTDDIGATNWQVREAACHDMEWCGLKLNSAANRHASGASAALINAGDSRVKVLAMRTDEELVIAEEGVKLTGRTINDSTL